MAPLQDSLRTLAERADVLNKRTDEFNGIIARVEQAINAAHPGVSFWRSELVCGEGEETDRDDETGNYYSTERGHFIGYTKVGDAWCLAAKAVKMVFEEGVDPFSIDTGKPVPLSKAPRVVRLEAAGLLEEVVEGVVERIDAYIASIAAAKKIAESL